MGDSGGGGVAAGAGILARDRRLTLAHQLLIYPMLDDRTAVPGALPESVLTWTYDDNCAAWSAVLGDDVGRETVSPIAAPARLADCQGLAPAYIEVGDLDIFRDEALVYAQRLARAGVPIEVHVHAGAPHGFERFAPQATLAQRALRDRARHRRAGVCPRDVNGPTAPAQPSEQVASGLGTRAGHLAHQRAVPRSAGSAYSPSSSRVRESPDALAWHSVLVDGRVAAPGARRAHPLADRARAGAPPGSSSISWPFRCSSA